MPPYSLLIVQKVKKWTFEISKPFIFLWRLVGILQYCFLSTYHILENSCTFQPRHGIQKNSGRSAVEIKLLHGAHDVSIHKLIHEIIISEQCFKEMPQSTVRISSTYNILNYMISIIYKWRIWFLKNNCGVILVRKWFMKSWLL